LANRDEGTRNAIRACAGLIDTEIALAAWDATMRVRAWRDRPRWIHGDLQSGNLLAEDGRLTAVIDFGCLGIGDPAGDLLPAWNLFSGESRAAFRETVNVDEATWARGRGQGMGAQRLGRGASVLPEFESGARRAFALRDRAGDRGLSPGCVTFPRELLTSVSPDFSIVHYTFRGTGRKEQRTGAEPTPNWGYGFGR
jgi:hypothetical protein